MFVTIRTTGNILRTLPTNLVHHTRYRYRAFHYGEIQPRSVQYESQRSSITTTNPDRAAGACTLDKLNILECSQSPTLSQRASEFSAHSSWTGTELTGPTNDPTCPRAAEVPTIPSSFICSSHPNHDICLEDLGERPVRVARFLSTLPSFDYLPALLPPPASTASWRRLPDPCRKRQRRGSRARSKKTNKLLGDRTIHPTKQLPDQQEKTEKHSLQ